MPPVRSVLVTGALGFLGRHVVSDLGSRGIEVRLLDDLSADPHGTWPASAAPPARFPRDVRQWDQPDAALTGVEGVVHLADRYVEGPRAAEALDVNVRGTHAILEAAARAGVARVVLASTGEVYGSAGAPPFPETRNPAPRSLHGASKGAQELLARAYAEQGAFQVVVLRLSDLYGPGMDRSGHPSPLLDFARSVLAGKPPEVPGTGEQIRDLLHVGDAVEAIHQALDRRVGGWTVVNVGSGVPTTLRALADQVTEVLGRPDLEPISVEEPPGFDPARFSEVRLSRSLLGFQPRITLREGLERKDWVPGKPA